MISESNTLPESWLAAVGGYDASGWLSAFIDSPSQAVSDLLWDSFYFGLLNLTDRLQLLQGWLDHFGNNDRFAERLDIALAEWVEENWGKFSHEGVVLASAWSCLCGIVEFSYKLPQESWLKISATALRAHFPEAQPFLGSFSTAPSEDPFGAYLCAIAEFQGDDRSLASFWHRMCDLPDGIPFYHGKYALLGLRRLRAADPAEDGTLRAEIVFGLLNLGKAFERLLRERRLQDDIAKVTYQSVAAETAAAFPGSPRWREHGVPAVFEVPAPVQQWLLEVVPPLAIAVRDQKRSKAKLAKTIYEDPAWSVRGREVAEGLERGDTRIIPKMRFLLAETRTFAEATGNSFHLALNLRSFAIRILRFNPQQAQRWAEEGLYWEPYNHYSWTTLCTVLLARRKLQEALRISWVAWKRFPEIDVTHNGLAEVLKASGRREEAEGIYRHTIERFPNDKFSRGGLAALLTARRNFDEAISLYRDLIKMSPTDVVPRHGLADTLRRSERFEEAEEEFRKSINSGVFNDVILVSLAHLILRKGDSSIEEALQLVDQALVLNPSQQSALKLRRELAPESRPNVQHIAKEWNDATNAMLDSRVIETPTAAIEVDHEEAIIWGDDSSPDAQPEANGGGNIRSHNLTSSRQLQVAALVAEAYFYRVWAKNSDQSAATRRLQKATELLSSALQLDPGNHRVLAEQAAVAADMGNKALALEQLTELLDTHSASIPLMVLKARLQREQASSESRRLTEASLAQLYEVPRQMRNLEKKELTPLFHFQSGLASLALTDGTVRQEMAAKAFSSFRRTLEYSANVESEQRRHMLPLSSRKVLRFHEWLKTLTDNHFFADLTESTTIQANEMPLVEAALARNSMYVIEVEDLFADRTVFNTLS